MLVPFQQNFIEIVREQPYKRVLTVMATSSMHLREFSVRSRSQVIPVAHHVYRAMVHVAESNLPLEMDLEALSDVETVERMTPPPVAYYYEYAHAGLKGNMEFSGSYCWAEELLKLEQSLLGKEQGMIGDPVFIPLFRVPMQLIHSSREKTDGESNPDTDTPN